MKSVANSIRKSLNHAEYELKPDNNILIDFGKTEDRQNDKHLQCYVAATRSRSKQSDEKVPDIFPLHGEHRKPEHVNRPRRKDDGHSTDPQVDLPPPPPCAPTNLQPIESQLPAQILSNKYDPFKIPKESTMDILQCPVPQIPTLTNPAYASQGTFIKNVPLDPITQHVDLRMKPKVYESLIKPVPVDVQLQGTLPPYDIDKLWNEYNWEQPEESVL